MAGGWPGAGPSEAIADGGYRLSKRRSSSTACAVSGELGARGIRINCTGPGVTETPFSTSCARPAGGISGFVHHRWGGSPAPTRQAAVLVYLGSRAASYITGQVIWVDGGTVAQRVAGELVDTNQGS